MEIPDELKGAGRDRSGLADFCTIGGVGHSNLKWRWELVLAAAMIALLLTAVASAGGSARTPGSSFPPDTSSHSRRAIPQDLTAARRPPHAFAQLSGPPIKISFPVDVNNVDFSDGSEPSIALDPANPNLIVVHAGFRDWGDGSQNASVYVSTDGGTTWNRRFPIDPPPGAADAMAPKDTTICYGANSQLIGSFLSNNGAIITGSTNAPSTDASFLWHLVNGVAQDTEQIATLDNDQPWVAVDSHPPRIIKGGLARIIPPIVMQNDVYVAYKEGTHFPTWTLRVAVSPGGNPPNFTADNQDGLSATGGNGKVNINPGHRLAVAPRTILPDGSVVTDLIYSLYQTCKNCSVNPPLVTFMLNRSRDLGATWNLNGSPSGIEVDEAFNRIADDVNSKFGTVNELLGGIDALAVDPSVGLVYVVYGNIADGFNVLSASRLFYNQRTCVGGSNPDTTCSSDANCSGGGSCTGGGVLVPGPRVPVSLDRVQAALPSVAVAANGTVGVLYDTFDGNDLSTGTPAFSAHLAVADGYAAELKFTDYTLLRFLSTAPDNHLEGQRVWGDYQQMIAFHNKFYGVFAGNGAALRRTRTASTDPIFFTADVSRP